MESEALNRNESRAEEFNPIVKGKENAERKELNSDLAVKAVIKAPLRQMEIENWDDDFDLYQENPSTSSTSSLALPLAVPSPSKATRTNQPLSPSLDHNPPPHSRSSSRSSSLFETPKKARNYSIPTPSGSRNVSASTESSEVENWDEVVFPVAKITTPKRTRTGKALDTTPIASRTPPVFHEIESPAKRWNSSSQRASFDFSRREAARDGSRKEEARAETRVEVRTRKRSSWRNVFGLTGKEKLQSSNRISSSSTFPSTTSLLLNLEGDSTAASTISTYPVKLDDFGTRSEVARDSEFSEWSEEEAAKLKEEERKRIETLDGTIRNRKRGEGSSIPISTGIYTTSRRPSIPLVPSSSSRLPLHSPSTKIKVETETRATKLLRRISGPSRQPESMARSPSAATTRPPSAGRNGFYNLISRSTSAIQVSKRAPSPSPADDWNSRHRSRPLSQGPSLKLSSATIAPPLPTLPPRSTSGIFHRNSASVDSKPTLLARVRTYSRSSKPNPALPTVGKERVQNRSLEVNVQSITPLKATERGLEVIPGSVSSKYLLDLQNSPTVSRKQPTEIGRKSKSKRGSCREEIVRPHTSHAIISPGDLEELKGRRNSLGSLRIPEKILVRGEKIAKDLENVKEFARGVEDLKRLRTRYQQLSPSKSNHLLYKSYWEQVDTLISLADGTSSPPTSSPPKARVPSTSALLDSEVESRKKEMLRDVLIKKGQSLPFRKESSPRPSILESPNQSRNSSPIKSKKMELSTSKTLPIPSLPFNTSPPPPTSTGFPPESRKVGKKMDGIKEFLSKLKLKGFENKSTSPSPSPSTTTGLQRSKIEGKRTVSDPTFNSLQRNQRGKEGKLNNLKEGGNSGVEDWNFDFDFDLGREGLEGSVVGEGRKEAEELGKDDLMELSTEGMPRLLFKVVQLKEKCEECIEVMNVV